MHTQNIDNESKRSVHLRTLTFTKTIIFKMHLYIALKETLIERIEYLNYVFFVKYPICDDREGVKRNGFCRTQSWNVLKFGN